MLIKGLQKTTLLDFPEKLACTVFTGGCNFRCPFCHNASLVTHIDHDSLDENEVLAYIEQRKKVLDGVCITGGEPMLQPDLKVFCEKIKGMGLLVKIDTNGSYPEKLKTLMDAGLVDYIAMDIKNSPEDYARTCGIAEAPLAVEQSIRLIMGSSVPYEFRTTVVREFHTPESIEALARHIMGAKKYFLQCFTDSGDLIQNGLTPYSPQEMQELLTIAQRYIPQAKLRGI